MYIYPHTDIYIYIYIIYIYIYMYIYIYIYYIYVYIIVTLYVFMRICHFVVLIMNSYTDNHMFRKYLHLII